MNEYKLDKAAERVAFLLDQLPQSKENYLMLILTYWQVFDGIDIPESVVQQIVEKATQPETITRARRKVVETAKLKQILELYRIAQAKKEG